MILRVEDYRTVAARELPDDVRAPMQAAMADADD